MRQVAAGGRHAVLVSEAGVLWTSGCGIEGQLGYAPAAQQYATSFRKVEGELFGRAVVSAAAGLARTVCVTRCGRVYAWGGTVAGKRGEDEGVGLMQCRSPRMLESGLGWSHLGEELRAREAAVAAVAARPRKGGMDLVDEGADDDGEMHVGAAVDAAGGAAVDVAGEVVVHAAAVGTRWAYGRSSVESAGMPSLMQEPAPSVMHQPAPTRSLPSAPGLYSSSAIPPAVVASHRARVLVQGPARRGRGEAGAGDRAEAEPPWSSPSGPRARHVPRLKLAGLRGASGCTSLVSGPSAPPRAGVVTGLRLRGGRDDCVRARPDLPGHGAGAALSQSLGAGRDAARPQLRPGISLGHAAEGASKRRGVRHARAHGPLNAGASARNPLARLGGSLGGGGGGACGAGVGVGAGRQTPDLWGRSGTRSCLNA